MDTKLNPEDVRDRLKIDRDDLDNELIAQPELVWQVGMQHVQAISDRDSQYEKLKHLKGKVAQKLRSGDEKMTVAAITAAVDSDRDVAESRKEELELEDEARRWEVCTESVKARGYALHKLVDLMLTQGAAIVGQSEGQRARRTEADAETQQALRDRQTRRENHAELATSGRRPRRF